MLPRQLHALRAPFVCVDESIRPRLCKSARRLCPRAAGYVTISDPPNRHAPAMIHLAHPKDPSNQSGSSQCSNAFPPPHAEPSNPPPADPVQSDASASTSGEANTTPNLAPFVPARFVHPPPIEPMQLPLPHATPSPPPHASPPFDTHKFFKVLSYTHTTPVARSIMRATRAILIDRIGRVKKDGLTTQDLESQAYLFKAALSELRTETSVLTRNETAAMRAATAALRREVDTLDTRMREHITTLKHEIQMDVDSRRNEAKSDLKHIDMQIEEVLSRALITIGELKTQVEESRWEKLKAAVGALAVLSLLIIISMEIYVVQPKRKRDPKPPPPQGPDLFGFPGSQESGS
ncbi:hypothetical protein C8Q80DRAFT_568175 [Daedaleopsis nitida]|nr:hypothetical protein C8Q80DRAFT_568175 [Daedaleopsis nitida]